MCEGLNIHCQRTDGGVPIKFALQSQSHYCVISLWFVDGAGVEPASLNIGAPFNPRKHNRPCTVFPAVIHFLSVPYRQSSRG